MTKGFARYEFLQAASLGSVSLEDTLTPLGRQMHADFAWNPVTKLLQTPPLASVATLVSSEAVALLTDNREPEAVCTAVC